MPKIFGPNHDEYLNYDLVKLKFDELAIEL